MNRPLEAPRRRSRRKNLLHAAVPAGMACFGAALTVTVPWASAADTPQSAEVDAHRESHQPATQPTVGLFPGRAATHVADDRNDPDEVPLPIPAEVSSSDAGDSLIRPAQGNPYFLGFAAGAYYPPTGEVLDPKMLAGLPAPGSDGRPMETTYGFVMFEKKITVARIAELESLGARVLGFHPHHALKVALHPAALSAVSGHDAVRWIGAPRPWQKRHPVLDSVIETTQNGTPIDVYINVYESDLCDASTSKPVGTMVQGDPGGVVLAVDREDMLPREFMSHGWQQHALEDLGVEVLGWEESVNAFRARLLPDALDPVLERDFVLFVDPILPSRLDHDESMAMVSADHTRVAYDGGTNLAALGGQIDSGLDYAHQGLSSFYWWGWNMSTSSNPSHTDLCGHGSHVAGTFHGDGAGESAREGAANGLGWGPTGRFFNIKIFNDSCSSLGSSPTSTRLAAMHTSVTDSNGFTTERPHVVNHSYGIPPVGSPWIGTETDARLFDVDARNYKQLHVCSAGNYGSGASTLGQAACAKNVLTVANVTDYWVSPSGTAGEISATSSRGPTGDNRWKPNVAAPGRQVQSVNAGTGDQYVNKSGTSMAAPHVAGVAAQMVDQHPSMRYRPEVIGACLMAGATRKDQFNPATPSTNPTHHLNQYGAGRVDALRSATGDANTALHYWYVDTGTSGYDYVDITVGPGATRLEVCMWYHEVAAGAGASKALINDIDMWIDAPPIQFGGNTGEYFGQQSPRDNTEIRQIEDPVPGTWRIKVFPDFAITSTSVGVGALISYGETSPVGTLTSTIDKTYIKPGGIVTVQAEVSNPTGFVASGVVLRGPSGGGVTVSSNGVLLDGSPVDYMDNNDAGETVTLGNLHAGQTREVTWRARYGASEGIKPFQVIPVSDNFTTSPASRVHTVFVDGTPPSAAGGLTSPSHPTSAWVADPLVDFTWTAPTDNLSGIAGYAWSESLGGSGDPGTTQTLGAVTSHQVALTNYSQGVYFNLRAVDRSGNWGPIASTGPYFVDATAPTPATGLYSPSHTKGAPSCNDQVQVFWTPGTDAHSGLTAVRVRWTNSNSPEDPNQALTIPGFSVGFTRTLLRTDLPYYLHVWNEDAVGNFSAEAIVGPYYIPPTASLPYCTAKVNSLGCTPSIGATGFPSLANSTLRVNCSQVLNKKPGILFWGKDSNATPFQGAFLCVKPPTQRGATLNSGGSPTGSDCTGVFDVPFSSQDLLNFGVSPGDDVYCQFWYRDPNDSFTTGLSNGLRFEVCN